MPPIEKVEVTDPLSGKRSMIALDRTGHNEKSLIVALADPNITRDQKDHALSMYLFQRGAVGVSMITDLLRYKGSHSRQSHVFKSQIRFDFEVFIGMFAAYLENQARLIGISLGVDIEKEQGEFTKWLTLPNIKGRGYSYKDFRQGLTPNQYALIEIAIHAKEEADIFRNKINTLRNARMAAKGGGVYVDRMGRPFDINDKGLDEIIKADREAEQQAKKLYDK